MRLVVKSFLGSGKSSKIGRGHLSGEASEAKNWMFGMLGKRSKVRWRYGCLSAERRRYDVRGRGVSEWAWREGGASVSQAWSCSICEASLGKVECGQSQQCGDRFLG